MAEVIRVAHGDLTSPMVGQIARFLVELFPTEIRLHLDVCCRIT